MNQRQYDLVQTFIKMGSAPKRIAKAWGIAPADMYAVQNSGSFKQYQEFTDEGGSLAAMKKMMGL
jgi:hypothetical protein